MKIMRGFVAVLPPLHPLALFRVKQFYGVNVNSRLIGEDSREIFNDPQNLAYFRS